MCGPNCYSNATVAGPNCPSSCSMIFLANAMNYCSLLLSDSLCLHELPQTPVLVDGRMLSSYQNLKHSCCSRQDYSRTILQTELIQGDGACQQVDTLKTDGYNWQKKAHGSSFHPRCVWLGFAALPEDVGCGNQPRLQRRSPSRSRGRRPQSKCVHVGIYRDNSSCECMSSI